MLGIDPRGRLGQGVDALLHEVLVGAVLKPGKKPLEILFVAPPFPWPYVGRQVDSNEDVTLCLYVSRSDSDRLSRSLFSIARFTRRSSWRLSR